MTACEVDRAVDRIARRQHGVFSDRQARGAGATSRIVRRRVATGRWVELGDHVYALPSHPGTWQRQCAAAVLSVEGAAVSHTTAAALHGLTGFRQGGVHIVVGRGTHHRSRLAIVHESSWPRLTTCDGIRTVTVADTLFQLAGCVDELRLATAFSDAVAADARLLGTLFERYVDVSSQRLRGITAMRELLAAHDTGEVPPANELERRLDQLLRDVPGLPPWRRQAPLPGWEDGKAHVDVLVADWRLIVEADGRRWHSRVSDFERDRWRDNLATAHGYSILRFTYHQLTARRDESVAVLRRFGAARSHVA